MATLQLQRKKQVFQQLIKWFYDFFNPNPKAKEDMLNLILPQVANMLVGFIKDEATDFGKEMLQKHFKQMPKEVQEAFDAEIDRDKSHGHQSLLELADKS